MGDAGEAMDTRWRIELLGGLRAARGDQVLTRFRTQQTGALLAYLAAGSRRGREPLRPELIELLWPGGDPHAGSISLRQALFSLRQQLEPEGVPPGSVLVADRLSVQLNPAAVTTDVAEFEAALQSAARAANGRERGEALARAVTLYRGELLPGHYQEWVLQQREWLAERYFRALDELIAQVEQAGELCRAIEYARQGVWADPLREEVHGSLMRLFAAAGRPEAALRQYRELERLLKQELDAAPGAATRALARALESQAPEPAASLERRPLRSAEEWEPIGGAAPLDSPFYVIRPTDAEFHAAIARRDSIVLVKGPRQVGKTSLLARGLQQARQAGARVVLTDFEIFNAAHLESAESVWRALAQGIADQLGLEVAADVWEPRRGPSPNFQRYLQRHVLGALPSPVVWGMDQVDRLFAYEFSGEIFGLFRSWHNARSLDPTGPWSRLTLAMAYATEAHLFITDLNKSPFNVGTRLTLEDFTLPQVADLNQRYGAPLRNEADLGQYYRLVGGHPYLVRRGLHELATRGIDLAAFEGRADSEDWIYGDHLGRLQAQLTRDPALCEVVRSVLQGRPCRGPESFYRLRSAGVMTGDSEREMRPRCQLYARYLARHLLSGTGQQ